MRETTRFLTPDNIELPGMEVRPVDEMSREQVLIKSIIRIVGGRVFPLSPGTTRVTVHWHGLSDSFVVTVVD